MRGAFARVRFEGLLIRLAAMVPNEGADAAAITIAISRRLA
jgi:hypothetical protein